MQLFQCIHLGLVRGIWVAIYAASVASAAAQFEVNVAAMTPPAPMREFRGVWVSSVGESSWLLRTGTDVVAQKAELIAIMDRAELLKLNAVIFQVRPQCDALYESRHEPWSEFLTGTMGRAPQPFFDPLKFAVEEAHKRGLELHAWFNPYRALHHSSKSPIAANHISKTRPELVHSYGRYLWLDPGEPAVRDHIINVMLDVVRRYDVDGVHIDDYFYPDPIRGADGSVADFPDDGSWKRFGAGGKLSRDDWRRENVNKLIERLYRSIQSAKPWVKFGVSPHGIWRPGNPPQIQGSDNYSTIYADSRKWLANGWLDYCAPQLYWSIDSKGQSFPVLLRWWSDQNPKSRHLWPGLNSHKVGSDWKSDEIVNQVRVTRKQPGVSGHIHWNMSRLMPGQSGLGEALQRQVYSQPALIPAMSWKPGSAPSTPKLTVKALGDDVFRAEWSAAGTNKVWQWVLQTRKGNQWTTEILPAQTVSRQWRLPSLEAIAVTAVDRVGRTSPPRVYQVLRR